jgi:hypothetical protein
MLWHCWWGWFRAPGTLAGTELTAPAQLTRVSRALPPNLRVATVSCVTIVLTGLLEFTPNF